MLGTSVIPISDAELYQRADVIVHGIVLSSDVTADDRGRPETLTVIEPLAVLKGRLTGSLVLHQPGGTLPDGRFFKLWGRPEYAPGGEVVVFAIARPEGEYETAEMILGKFEVWQDESGNLFAVPDLAAGVHPGVEVQKRSKARRFVLKNDPTADEASRDEYSPRELTRFLASLRSGVFEKGLLPTPSGKLEPIHHAEKVGRATPLWGYINNTRYRWNNNATATWTISGTANMDGGGVAEAQGALASWTNDSNSTINYVPGGGMTNVLYVNATTSTLGCGWSTCLTGGGVIGCGGPTGVGGSNIWRGDTYSSISQGTVELRASCIFNGFGSTITQSVITHELGHTLGLGHSDQNVSTHDVCRGDEDAATMRSVVQNRTRLGTDDQDAIRWLYGDGGNSCSVVSGGNPCDFNGDGKTDILWHHTSGAVYLWLMNGTSIASGANLPSADPAWSIVGTADFNGDGKPDILWRNSTSGAVYLWLMTGTAIASGANLPSADPSWSISATGDFNGDGKPDILWRHTSGAVNVWFMNGATRVSGATLPPADPSWSIAGTGDFNGDGKTDILWHHTSGAVYAWLMNGTTVASGANLSSADPSWTISSTGDFNGDGKTDILWRHTSGAVYAWLMNGTTVAAGANLPSADPSWSIVGPK